MIQPMKHVPKKNDDENLIDNLKSMDNTELAFQKLSNSVNFLLFEVFSFNTSLIFKKMDEKD